ncbi:hypothetical protein N7468_006175 [Penicillium chermesinum]|uniref:MARVEL domain-containing protein n=1 Tax=Penicillium chermesinum TaxID=63820 RepID=A0A9W9NRT7_9EURO|nr:uncharacterized protein N7468_006175 [Penicillium chermesinum]KAJ5224950.1 hypothetical protein N7468_006175 [Penicillium chermesinum]
MLPLHIALYSLLATALAFAIIELGLTAYVTSAISDYSREELFRRYWDYSYSYWHVSTPSILIFLLFTSCWTILASAGALAAHGLAAVYFVTMVFWLAAFADFVSYFDGNFFSDYLSAIVAFAVLDWLLFLALFIVTILALCGVLVSDWPGYHSFRGAHTQKEKSAPADASAAPHDVPMSTNPVAPSELSSRDTEALHDQPHTRAFSPSSRSAVTSAELSGDVSPDHHNSTTHA